MGHDERMRGSAEIRLRLNPNTITDLCLSDFLEIFAVHEGFSDKQIRKIYNWNL
ncbi:hypothetical protein GH880_25935 [Bacillus thuringiensis]|nr:hypothetical protein [Bacillus thuringiensis]